MLGFLLSLERQFEPDLKWLHQFIFASLLFSEFWDATQSVNGLLLVTQCCMSFEYSIGHIGVTFYKYVLLLYECQH